MATERIVLATESLVIGRFRCSPDDVRWRRPNWIGPRHHVVFPARSVLIEQDGQGAVLADPNHVVLYDAGRTYHRELVSPDGDLSTYVAVSEPVVRGLLRDSDDGAPRFGRPEVPLAPEPLLQLHLLLGAIEGGTVDVLEAEEKALDILDVIVARIDEAPVAARRARTRRAHERLVLDTKLVLSQRFAEPLSLAQVGRLVGASPFHLARLFRASTGHSLHGYREQIRLRRALERLASRGPARSVAWVAAEVGFGSHAHFDTRFRRTFGRTPSDIHEEMGASRRPPAAVASLLDETRTIAKGDRPSSP